MPGQPSLWNVVVAGSWNVAILNPRGVATRLFKAAPEVSVEVQVNIDQPGPLRVLYAGIAVVPSSSKLIVEPEVPSVDSLKMAATIAARAIQSLPETPLSAVGVNVQYKFDETPDELITALRSHADEQLSDADQRVLSRAMKRTLKWKDGVLNLEIREAEDTSCHVSFNFHRKASDVDALQNWLKETESMIESVNRLLTQTFHLEIEDDNAE